MQLERDAHFNGYCCEVLIRLASHKNSIYIDMANENWDQIEISEESWQKASGNESPVKFKRTPGMLPIAYPDLKDSVNAMGEFLKLESEAAFHLIVGWLIGTIKPDVGAGYPMHDVRLLRGHRNRTGVGIRECINRFRRHHFHNPAHGT